MSMETAITHALSEQAERDAPTLVPVPEQQPPLDPRTQGLTAREQEIALLVGRGANQPPDCPGALDL
jgi:ribosomal protein S12 methylthiotransferase accessory factor YcaO